MTDENGEDTGGVPRLGPVEARVLGVLVEKQMTTPDVYPLTLAAVVAGANQSTNRDPVMDLSETEVEPALVRLHDIGLATPVRRAGDRATKYRHKLGEFFEIDERAQAVVAVLLLRGAQTSGELRSRTERYVAFATIDEVESVVDDLETAGLAERLARSPGQSQRRVSQLLSSPSAPEPSDPEEAAAVVDDTDADGLATRLSELERRFSELLAQLGVDDI